MAPARKTKPALFLALLSCIAILLFSGCGGGGGGGGESGGVGGESTPTPAATGVSLSWDSPSSVTDGAPLPGLAGFLIYFGTSSQQYENVIDAGNARTYAVTLAPGTYYFTITAYDASGNETEFSDEIVKTIQ